MRRLLILIAMLSLAAPMLRAQDVHVSGSSRGPAYAIGGGTAQAQTVTLNPVRSLVAGLEINFLPNAANTSAGPTLAVNGGSAITITKLGTSALAANDLNTTTVAVVVYDGTRFQLRNPQTTTKRVVLPYGLCSAGTTAAAAWDTPASNAAVAACKVGGTNNTVQGTLQFADAQIAYYSGIVPSDWTAWGIARLTFTTSDTTNGHTVIFNLALACDAPNGGLTDDPAYGGANAFTTVTIGGGAVANASYQTSTGALTGGSCAAGSAVHWKLTRATDTVTDTSVAATGWLEITYQGNFQ